MRQFATPEAFKQALEQRLLADANLRGQDVNRLRQLLIFDRFLARIFASSGEWLLKGGLALGLRTPKARTTRDVDLRTLGDPHQILSRLQQAMLIDLGDHLSFEVGLDRDSPTIEGAGALYGGRRFRVLPTLAGRVYAAPFGVDVVIGGPVIGEVDLATGKLSLVFAGIQPGQMRIVPVEQHIAEKLHALTLPRPTANSRVRDLPDLLLLGGLGRLTAQQIGSAVEATFAFRATHSVPASLPPLPSTWADKYAKITREIDLPWPTLVEAAGAARVFLEPVLAGVSGIWEGKTWRWGMG